MPASCQPSHVTERRSLRRLPGLWTAQPEPGDRALHPCHQPCWVAGS